MTSLPRRSPPGFRQNFATVPQRTFPWRLGVSVLGGSVLLSGFAWLLTRQPRGLECLTTESTVCPEEIAASFSPLAETPLWRVELKKEELIVQAQEDPRVLSAQVSISPLQIVKVKVELAHALLPFSAEGKNWKLLSNGKPFPTDEASFPQVEFSSLEQVEKLTENERDEISTLYQRLRSFSPRIRKILVLTSTEVEVYPENAGKILFTLQDVQRQLATLQAFFRSTTINQTYQVLDVRFSEVAVIKE